MAAELAGKRTIVVVPDPHLENVPFAALVDEAGQFLFERFVIVVSPSAAAFARRAASRPIPPDPRVLIVTGDESLGELSALEREARSVGRLYDRVTRLSREIATPGMFVREARTAHIIHFAGHAIDASPGAPAGYLALQRGEDGDGKLDAKEIAALRLDRPSLVVLAACSTAAGEVRESEGTISIARSFLAAGVPAVIGTLWPVEDTQAAEFFPVVHRYLARGLPPPEAVRAAQLEWMQRPDTPDSLWTAVQAIGR